MASTPKYAKVQQGIINLIIENNWKPGDILPTEKELVDIFKVSVITIRSAMQKLQSAGIVSKRQGKGTFVSADIGQSGNGKIIYLEIVGKNVIPFTRATVANDISGTITQKGYTFEVLFSGEKPSSEIIQALQEAKGIIATGKITDEWTNVFMGINVPVITLGALYTKKCNITNIDYDWEKLSFNLTKDIIAKGANNIALIACSPEYLPSECMKTGFKKALDKSKLIYSNSNVLSVDDSSRYENISNFFDKKQDYDAILVEAGNYLPLLEYLYSKNLHPLVGVLGTTIKTYLTDKIISAGFEENIFIKSIELLFEQINGESNEISRIKLSPIIK
jgi:DNA-binding LacI/PurR family transcriptional regulator